MDYYSLNQYLRDKFGGKVYKIALDGGFTCPNRDGSVGFGGCIFCAGDGSGAFAGNRQQSIAEQIETGKVLVEKKMGSSGKEKPMYIAYFQNFTGTYAPVERLKELYLQAIAPEEVVALSIATRPDCISDEVLKLLCEINKKKPVWIELGLQTIHEKTAHYIRRGYELFEYDDAVERLKEKGITVITHMILGLPNETKEMMLQTAEHIGRVGSDGIKLQLLHVLKGTDLALEYEIGKFEVLSMEEYIQIVVECLAILPKDMVIHRLTGDGDKKQLLAPLWSADKKRVLNELSKAIAEYSR